MPVRETSIQVYKQIEASGLLAKQELEVLSAFANHGPATARENDVRCGIAEVVLGRSLQPTITRLVSMDVLCEVGKRPCTVTGRTVLVYDMTGRLPRALERAPTLTKKEWREAHTSLWQLTEMAEEQGVQVPDELRKLMDIAFYKGWSK